MQFSDPKVDFFTKSYLILFLIPYIGVNIWTRLFYFLGKDLWEIRGEGAFVYSLWAVLTGYFLHFFLLLVSTIFLLVSNRRLMSGSFLSKKTRFGLFSLAFLLYLVTMYFLSLFM